MLSFLNHATTNLWNHKLRILSKPLERRLYLLVKWLLQALTRNNHRLDSATSRLRSSGGDYTAWSSVPNKDSQSLPLRSISILFTFWLGKFFVQRGLQAASRCSYIFLMCQANDTFTRHHLDYHSRSKHHWALWVWPEVSSQPRTVIHWLFSVSEVVVSHLLPSPKVSAYWEQPVFLEPGSPAIVLKST